METRFNNLLLGHMHPDDLALLDPHLLSVPLPPLARIADAGEPVSKVYFVETGVISVVSKLDDGRAVEAGIIGLEGMSGDALALGDVYSPYSLHVQMEGFAQAIDASAFAEAIERSRRLHKFMLLFVRAFTAQLSSTIVANRRSSLEQRLARLLLMTFDRLDGNNFRVTHDSLAWLLSVQRPGLTVALHTLEGLRLIKSNRTEIVVLDPEGLEDFSKGAYGFAEREYRRLFGRDFRLRERSPVGRSAPKLVTPADDGGHYKGAPAPATPHLGQRID